MKTKNKSNFRYTRGITPKRFTGNELRGPSPQLSACATQLRRNVAGIVSRWQHRVRFDRPGNQTADLSHR